MEFVLFLQFSIHSFQTLCIFLATEASRGGLLGGGGGNFFQVHVYATWIVFDDNRKFSNVPCSVIGTARGFDSCFIAYHVIALRIVVCAQPSYNFHESFWNLAGFFIMVFMHVIYDLIIFTTFSLCKLSNFFASENLWSSYVVWTTQLFII